ncbi:MAG: AAA family ATPase [Bacteroidales bacterium]|nr:AAA family ATPase [Bacteroidales bacterium]
MRLEQLILKNLRLFGDEEQTINFSADKNITVFLGDNGAGKTTILHGCTVVLSNLFTAFPDISYKAFTDTDVRAISNTQRADFIHLGLGIVNANNTIQVDQYKKGNSNDTPKSNLIQLKEYANLLKERIDANECVAVPILAYYGTERGQINPPERRRDFNKIFPRWDAFKDSLEPATNFKRFFTWFERNEDEERREKEARRDWHYRSYVLEAVRNALNKLDERYYRPRVLISPLRFVMDDISELEPDERNQYRSIFSTSMPPAGFEGVKEVRIEQMSDGYRIMIAMIADIAARMAEANPSPECSGLDDPLNTPGIVFIDEIDLHLHPMWQRKVLRQLHTIFPNVQFIVTTHSPNVVMGALDLVQVVKLENGVIHNDVDMSQFNYYDISQLLLSDLFELDNVRSDEYLKIKQERYKLIHKDAVEDLSDEERYLLKDLDRKISLYDPREGEEMRQVIKLLDEIAHSTCHD